MCKTCEQDETPAQALAEAIEAFPGGRPALEQALGKRRQLWQWLNRDGRCPAGQAKKIERLTGVPAWRLRPDVFDPPEDLQASEAAE